MRYKLGKLPPKFHPKTLHLAAFLRADAPPPPPEKTFWEYKIPPDTIGMFGNDTIGDCTCAEVAHHIMLLTGHTSTIFVPDEADVIAMYSAVSGYVPGDDSTDNGTAITDVLNYWQTTGLAGHKIDGWASIDPTNRLHRNQAVYLFGGCSVGVQLPQAAQDQFSAGATWMPVPDDPIEGGHCILESGYGALGRNFETWGKGNQKAINGWDTEYVDEVYVPLSHDWISAANDLSPSSMNWDALVAALDEIKA